MDLLDLLLLFLLAPALLLGMALGIAGACLLHWLAPAPEPIAAEAVLVALGFFGGLVCSWWLEQSTPRKPF